MALDGNRNNFDERETETTHACSDLIRHSVSNVCSSVSVK